MIVKPAKKTENSCKERQFLKSLTDLAKKGGDRERLPTIHVSNFQQLQKNVGKTSLDTWMLVNLDMWTLLLYCFTY